LRLKRPFPCLKARHWFALGALVVGVIFFGSALRLPQAARQAPPIVTSPRLAVAAVQQESGEENEPMDEADVRSSILADWEALRVWLSLKPDAKKLGERLSALRERWVTLDPQVLASVLGELLATGDDARTGMAFEVGPHGLLAGWTTLRVFLLDVLAASDPERAAVIARAIADRTSSAEEYAMALRSLTQPGLGRATDAELLERLNHLLAQPGWSGTPGLAEALDLPRVLGSPAAARALAAWPGNGRLRDMALHEFAAEHPAEMLGVLSSEDSPISPDARAALMARAQVEDPVQSGQIDAYLHRSDVSTEEIAAFLRLFPLRSATTGDRLYGFSPAPYSSGQLAVGDRAALALAERWLADPALAAVHSEVDSLKARLGAWVKQAEPK